MRERLLAYIRDELVGDPGGPDLAAEADLLGSGLLDSLGMMSLVFFIEQELGVRVPPEDVTIENFVSVAAIESYLDRRSDSLD